MTLDVDGWPGRVLLAWLQIHRPNARRLMLVDPAGADLDDVDHVLFGFTGADGDLHEFTATGADLDDLRRFYDDADYPPGA